MIQVVRGHPFVWIPSFALAILIGGLAVTSDAMQVFGITFDGAPEVRSSPIPPNPEATIPTPTSTDAGWGPSRKLYTIESPAQYAVLNSITNNPNYGDERDFFTVIPNSDLKVAGHSFKNAVKVAPGDLLTFRVFYENSAADNFDASSPSWIQGATALLSYETKPSLSATIVMTLKADNSASIWDGVALHSERLFKLSYEAGSSRLYNNANSSRTGGYLLNFDQLRSASGMKIGYQALDGTIRPGYKYAGYIYFDMRIVDAS
ncbi:hypothetical protein J2Y68_003087 [Paenarthrobacter nitroguajacolicus]|nr:hypothetical protein [Paenarthrobacter nitroguajacolicus]